MNRLEVVAGEPFRLVSDTPFKVMGDRWDRRIKEREAKRQWGGHYVVEFSLPFRDIAWFLVIVSTDANLRGAMELKIKAHRRPPFWVRWWRWWQDEEPLTRIFWIDVQRRG